MGHSRNKVQPYVWFGSAIFKGAMDNRLLPTLQKILRGSGKGGDCPFKSHPLHFHGPDLLRASLPTDVALTLVAPAKYQSSGTLNHMVGCGTWEDGTNKNMGFPPSSQPVYPEECPQSVQRPAAGSEFRGVGLCQS